MMIVQELKVLFSAGPKCNILRIYQGQISKMLLSTAPSPQTPLCVWATRGRRQKLMGGAFLLSFPPSPLLPLEVGPLKPARDLESAAICGNHFEYSEVHVLYYVDCGVKNYTRPQLSGVF